MFAANLINLWNKRVKFKFNIEQEVVYHDIEFWSSLLIDKVGIETFASNWVMRVEFATLETRSNLGMSHLAVACGTVTGDASSSWPPCNGPKRLRDETRPRLFLVSKVENGTNYFCHCYLYCCYFTTVIAGDEVKFDNVHWSYHNFQAIRVIANLSISPEAGAGVAAHESLVDLLIQILGKLTLVVCYTCTFLANLVPRVLVTLVQWWSGQQGPLG